MNFRTIIHPKTYSFNIDYPSRILFLGSCFSDNISKKLIDGGFSVTANPFGVLYNPISIKNALNILLKQKLFSENDLVENHGLYHSFSHHGSFSKTDPTETLKLINHSIINNSNLLQTTNLAFITFGTAYVYQYLETQEIISNCHKIPAKKFKHFALTVDDIVQEYNSLLKKLITINPELQIIFTVSPVRHWKDGAHENQLSKATLHLAIAQLQTQFDFVHYYPSYELIMDDLRDYRFYSEDMIHISPQAVDYIYNHFQKSFYSDETKDVEKQILKLKQALNHRPFNPNTKEHIAFVKNTKKKIELLKEKYPEIIL